MEGVHQIAVRILTLTAIFSSLFHRYFYIFFTYLKNQPNYRALKVTMRTKNQKKYSL